MREEMIYKSVAELEPYISNPRKNEDAVDAVAKSIEEFGFKVPIVIDKNNEIVAGHTRLKAAKKLGLEEVPTIIADDLSDEKIKAFRLADNKVAELSYWDEEVLQNELAEIEGINMSDFGFEELLQSDVEDDGWDDVDIEGTEEDEPMSSVGQLYQLGNHRLLIGDATNEKDMKRLLGNAWGGVDLYITDPPYNVNYGADPKVAKSQQKNTKKMTIMNDSMDSLRFRQFLVDTFAIADKTMHPGASYYIFHSESEGVNFRTAVTETGWPIKQCLIWVKNSMVIGRQDYQWRHEPALYGWKEGAGHYFIDDRTQDTVIDDQPNINRMSKDELKTYIKELYEMMPPSTIIREDKPKTNDIHPTMKPVKLFGKLIHNSTKKGDIVLDTFGGSGTTAIACEQLGRKAYLMELDPKYADAIINRYEEYTGEKAVLIEE